MFDDSGREFEAQLQAQLSLALGVAFRVVGSREEAEDIVQNAAIRAWKSFDSFEAGTHFRAWFLKIVVNLALNAKRDAARRPVSLEIESEDEKDAVFAQARAARRDSGEPATAFMAKIEAQEIEAALQQLPPEFRAVAALHFLEEMSYEEIAAIVDCPLGTVRSRLHRARRILQRELWETAREMGIAPRDLENGKSPKDKSKKSLNAAFWLFFGFLGVFREL